MRRPRAANAFWSGSVRLGIQKAACGFCSSGIVPFNAVNSRSGAALGGLGISGSAPREIGSLTGYCHAPGYLDPTRGRVNGNDAADTIHSPPPMPLEQGCRFKISIKVINFCSLVLGGRLPIRQVGRTMEALK
jgi:hypothetical protein